MPGHWKFKCPSLKATNNFNNQISSVSALSACKESHKSPDIISKINHNIGESKSRRFGDLSETDEKCLSPAGRLEWLMKGGKKLLTIYIYWTL